MKRLRRLWGLVLKCTAGLMIALSVALAWFVGPALYHRYYLFPKQEVALRQLREQRREASALSGWKELVAATHVHSRLSHDSEIPFEEVLTAAHAAQVDVVFWGDHPIDKKAVFSRQWTGIHEGVRFIRGFEMRYGFMPWGLPENAVLDADQTPELLARRIRELGGTLFFVHVEESRHWELPEVAGMELYNIHAAFKKVSVVRMVPDILLNGARYPDLTLRLILERPTANLQLWDRLARERKMAGMAGNDAHQNSGLRGAYTERDTLRLTTTGPREVVGEWRLNWLTRGLLGLLYGPLQTTKPLFRYEADRHENMMRHISTHLWVRDQQEDSALEALRNGRSFLAFDHLASARGFRFWLEAPGPQGKEVLVMGEERAWRAGATLRAESPLPCRFTLIREGQPAGHEVGYSWTAGIDQPGRYRLEAELRLLGEWTPWVYTNPVYLTEAR